MTIARDELIHNFQRDRRRLIAYIRALVGDPDLTEDIFQEVTVVVLNKADEFDPRYDLQAWCRGIARNIIKRERTRSKRLPVFKDDAIVELVDKAFEENTEHEFAETQRTVLLQCLQLLSPANKDLLEQRYTGGLSLRQLAGQLRRTELAVQVALSRLRKALGQCVQRRGEGGLEQNL
jgi:RNA polymerase sigma-70 factor, ECF subfamily